MSNAIDEAARIKQAARVQSLLDCLHEPLIRARLTPNRHGRFPGRQTALDYQIATLRDQFSDLAQQSLGTLQRELADGVYAHNTIAGVRMDGQVSREACDLPAEFGRGAGQQPRRLC